MLPGLARIYVERGHAAPVVTRLKTESHLVHFWQAYVKPHSALQDAGSLASGPGVGRVSEVTGLAQAIQATRWGLRYPALGSCQDTPLGMPLAVPASSPLGAAGGG